MNATLNHQVSPNLARTLDNLLDAKPCNRDTTWTRYPYCASSWCGPVGRAFFGEVNYRFGVRRDGAN